MRPRWVLAAVVPVALLAACGGATATGTSAVSGEGPRRGGDLVVARAADSPQFDPLSDNESIWVWDNVVETLYTNAPDGKEPKPWLATGYTLSPDKRTWTFALRKGVAFSTGTPVTAADVKFSLDRARDPKGPWAFIDAAIDRVDAPDPGTVVVHTKYPWAPLLADLALADNGVIPKDYAGQARKDFFEHPIGTGPFRWSSWTKGSELRLVRNEHYWQPGKPYLDSVTWKVVPDDQTRLLQLRGGQAQVDEFPPFSAVKSLQSTPNVRMDLFQGTGLDYLTPNFARKPWDDVHARRALSLAVDRDALVRAVYFGNAKAANSLFMPTLPFYDASAPGGRYDVEQAKAELARSSVPQGFSFEFLYASGSRTQTTIAQLVQSDLAKIGVKVALKGVEQNALYDLWSKGQYDVAVVNWTMDILDPDEWVSFAVDAEAGGANAAYTGYRNPDVVRLARAAQRETDPARRADVYRRLQAATADDAHMVYLAYLPFPYASSTSVHGFTVYPTGNYHLEDVWLGTP